MHLSDIQTPEDLGIALASGDPQLAQEVEELAAKQVRYSVMRRGDPHHFTGKRIPEQRAVVRPPYVAALDLLDEADRAVVADLPRHVLEQAVQSEVGDAIAAYAQNSQADSIFVVRSGPTPSGHSLVLGPMLYTVFVHLESPPLKWLPAREATALLQRVGPADARWFHYGPHSREWASDWIDVGDVAWVELANREQGEAREWAVDLRQRYFSDLADEKPEAVVPAFLTAVEREHPELHRSIRKHKPPADVLLAYATTYLTDPAEGHRVVAEAMGAFGYEGSRAPVLLEVDRDTLRELGITEGRWWHGAPWRLVDLPPEELAYEGTLMRHCVGRFDMGYREAVEQGDKRIWSLRSAFNRPILTWAVDVTKWENAESSGSDLIDIGSRSYPENECLRAHAVVQLKGKVNRSAPKDIDEAKVLYWIFDRLGIAPACVREFSVAIYPRDTSGRVWHWKEYQASRAANPYEGIRERLLAW